MTAHHNRGPSKLNALAQCTMYQSADGETGEAASRGTALHAAIAARSVLGLSPADARAVQYGIDRLTELGDLACEVPLELRLCDDDPFAPPDSYGTADYVGHGNIVEIKTGQHRDYTPQLTAYALMAMQSYGWSTVYCHTVYIDQEHCWYVAVTRGDAEYYIRDLWRRLDDPTETPCDYCGWCARRGSCATIARQTERGLVAAGLDVPGSCAIDRLTDPAQMARAMEIAALAEQWAERVRSHVRERMIAGDQVPGYHLQTRAGRPRISDLESAHQMSGLSAGEFLACCDVGIDKLRAAYRASNPGAGKRGLDDALGDSIKYGAPVKCVAKNRGKKEVEEDET